MTNKKHLICFSFNEASWFQHHHTSKNNHKIKFLRFKFQTKTAIAQKFSFKHFFLKLNNLISLMTLTWLIVFLASIKQCYVIAMGLSKYFQCRRTLIIRNQFNDMILTHDLLLWQSYVPYMLALDTTRYVTLKNEYV